MLDELSPDSAVLSIWILVEYIRNKTKLGVLDFLDTVSKCKKSVDIISHFSTQRSLLSSKVRVFHIPIHIFPYSTAPIAGFLLCVWMVQKFRMNPIFEGETRCFSSLIAVCKFHKSATFCKKNYSLSHLSQNWEAAENKAKISFWKPGDVAQGCYTHVKQEGQRAHFLRTCWAVKQGKTFFR